LGGIKKTIKKKSGGRGEAKKKNRYIGHRGEKKSTAFRS